MQLPACGALPAAHDMASPWGTTTTWLTRVRDDLLEQFASGHAERRCRLDVAQEAGRLGDLQM